MPAPPTTEAELLERAFALAGLSIGELAKLQGIDCPSSLKRQKGWVGTLLEISLGASAGSKPEQDFAHLGIELKTIPINHAGKALETTFVCVAPLVDIQGLSWENSHIRNKLSKVLWVPIEGEKQIPLAARKIGMPFLWTPSPAEELQLQADWEELMEFIALGKLDKLNASYGTVLQLRPKAANSQAKTQGYGKNGELIQTLPRGFYLRTQFTSAILAKHFML